MGYVFRIEKGCFGEEEGGHGRAWEHGGAVPSFWSRVLSFCTGLQVCGFLCFGLWYVLGCNLGHLSTLALISNDV